MRNSQDRGTSAGNLLATTSARSRRNMSMQYRDDGFTKKSHESPTIYCSLIHQNTVDTKPQEEPLIKNVLAIGLLLL